MQAACCCGTPLIQATAGAANHMPDEKQKASTMFVEITMHKLLRIGDTAAL